VTKAAGRPLRRIQGGLVQNYLLIAAIMVLGLVVTFFVIIFQMPQM